jgi:hypothetical protein
MYSTGFNMHIIIILFKSLTRHTQIYHNVYHLNYRDTLCMARQLVCDLFLGELQKKIS